MRDKGPAPKRVSFPGDPGWFDSGPEDRRDVKTKEKRGPLPKPISAGALAGSDWRDSGPPRPEHEVFRRAQGGIPRSMKEAVLPDRLPAAAGHRECEYVGDGCGWVGKERDHDTHVLTAHTTTPEIRKERGKKLGASNRNTGRMLTHDGKTMSVADWAKETGLKRGNIYQRLKMGWSDEKTLTTPLQVDYRKGASDRG